MKRILLALLALAPSWASAQIGADAAFEFLTLANTARINALGGSLITVKDDDAGLAFQNPALLNPLMDKQISFNHSFYMANINHGYVGYAQHVKSINTTFHTGIQYADYGKFTTTDATGQAQGEFKAKDWSWTIGAGRMLSDKLSVGANLRMAGSRLESYNAFGMTVDLAAMYADTARRTNVTFVIRNAGFMLNNYDDKREPMPMDIQFGISHKVKYLPIRLSIIAHQLQRLGIRYDNPADRFQTNIFGQQEEVGPGAFGRFTDNFFRHFIFNAELLLGKKETFRARIGYNHLRRGELSVKGLRSIAGFSFGFGIRVAKIRFDYGWAGYHIAGGSHQLTLSTSLNSFIK